MFGVILKATNSSFQKAMAICRSIYMKKVMKLLAFIFEHPSYNVFIFIQIIMFSKPFCCYNQISYSSFFPVPQTDRKFWKFYSPKLLVVGLIWISAVTLVSWQKYNELQDPTYYYRLDTSNFMVSLL